MLDCCPLLNTVMSTQLGDLVRKQFPHVAESVDFMFHVAPTLLSKSPVPRTATFTDEDIVWIPVGCLLWTHDRINPRLEFSKRRLSGRSLGKLLDQLLNVLCACAVRMCVCVLRA